MQIQENQTYGELRKRYAQPSQQIQGDDALTPTDRQEYAGATILFHEKQTQKELIKICKSTNK